MAGKCSFLPSVASKAGKRREAAPPPFSDLRKGEYQEARENPPPNGGRKGSAKGEREREKEKGERGARIGEREREGGQQPGAEGEAEREATAWPAAPSPETDASILRRADEV